MGDHPGGPPRGEGGGAPGAFVGPGRHPPQAAASPAGDLSLLSAVGTPLLDGLAMYAGLSDTDKAAVWTRLHDSGFGR